MESGKKREVGRCCVHIDQFVCTLKFRRQEMATFDRTSDSINQASWLISELLPGRFQRVSHDEFVEFIKI